MTLGIDEIISSEVKHNFESLCKTFKFDFRICENQLKTSKFILSPEEQKDQSHTIALENMRVCMNLDEFFDVVFQVEQSFIKGNSLILKARSNYFNSMLSKSHKFNELNTQFEREGQKYCLVKINGVPKVYFNCVI